MQGLLSSEEKERLLARHQALTNLVHHIPANTSHYFSFLDILYKFEKTLELQQPTESIEIQILSNLVQNEHDLRKVFFSKEWKKVKDYFSCISKAETLIDVCNLLEIGNLEGSLSETEDLRKEILAQAFFENFNGKTIYKKVALFFVFSDAIPRWSVERILWDDSNLSEDPKEVFGEMKISLGTPPLNYQNHLYRNIFAVCGDEIKSAGVIALESLRGENRELEKLTQQIILDIDFELSSFQENLKNIPKEQRKKLQEWQNKNALEREFSSHGLVFLAELLITLESNFPLEYSFVKNRLARWGMYPCEQEKTIDYDFCEDHGKGQVVYRQMALDYFWPPDKQRKIAFPGKSFVCAGSPPRFLQEIKKLEKFAKLSLREGDLQNVKQMLLYLQLGEKVPKPPILPVYNALRRWFETLAEQEDHESIEKMCVYAKIFRPHIYIPFVGEKVSFSDKQHEIIYISEELSKKTPNKPIEEVSQNTEKEQNAQKEQERGTILKIKKAAIIIPKGNMPLCLAGKFVVAGKSEKEQEVI